jgi:hypothetical protein
VCTLVVAALAGVHALAVDRRLSPGGRRVLGAGVALCVISAQALWLLGSSGEENRLTYHDVERDVATITHGSHVVGKRRGKSGAGRSTPAPDTAGSPNVENDATDDQAGTSNTGSTNTDGERRTDRATASGVRTEDAATERDTHKDETWAYDGAYDDPFYDLPESPNGDEIRAPCIVSTCGHPGDGGAVGPSSGGSPRTPA